MYRDAKPLDLRSAIASAVNAAPRGSSVLAELAGSTTGAASSISGLTSPIGKISTRGTPVLFIGQDGVQRKKRFISGPIIVEPARRASRRSEHYFRSTPGIAPRPGERTFPRRQSSSPPPVRPAEEAWFLGDCKSCRT